MSKETNKELSTNPSVNKENPNIPKVLPLKNTILKVTDYDNLSEFSGYRGYERQKKETMRENILSSRNKQPTKIHKETSKVKDKDDLTNPYQEKIPESKIKENKIKNFRNVLRKKKFDFPEKNHFAGDYLKRSRELNLFEGKLKMVDRVTMLKEKDIFLLNLRRKKYLSKI